MGTYVFIMAGGSGTRFWPLSTKEKPKQLLKLVSNKTMIRETADRILPIIPPENVFVGTNKLQSFGISKELFDIPKKNIIIEPAFKDTAAAIGYGALKILEKDRDGVMVVLASDHLIKDEEGFRNTIIKAVDVAIEENALVTLGIRPDKPETGYGYIEVDKNYEMNKPTKVKRFWEKPSKERAEVYLAKGNYLWNSGMFIWKAETILNAIKEYLPNHYEILMDIKNGADLKSSFEKFEKISIDFGVMEKHNKVRVIPVNFGWNDIGSFSALHEVFDKNANNSVDKTNNLIEINAKNNVVIGNKTIAIIGLENIVVVEEGDKLLICHKDQCQKVKKITQL